MTFIIEKILAWFEAFISGILVDLLGQLFGGGA
jgi:hypothetical protein